MEEEDHVRKNSQKEEDGEDVSTGDSVRGRIQIGYQWVVACFRSSYDNIEGNFGTILRPDTVPYLPPSFAPN